jgi:hypothetical protein
MSNFSPKPLSEDSFKNLIKIFEGTTQAKMEAKYDYVDETAVPFKKKPTNQMKITEFSINEDDDFDFEFSNTDKNLANRLGVEKELTVGDTITPDMWQERPKKTSPMWLELISKPRKILDIIDNPAQISGPIVFLSWDPYKIVYNNNPYRSFKIKDLNKFLKPKYQIVINGNLNENESLEEMANFFTVTREQQASINPEDYKGTKQLVAKAIKNDIKPGEHFTKATIQGIINKDPLKDFNFVVDSENIESQGKTSDVKPKEPKTTTGKKGRPSTGVSKPKETSTDTKASKIVARKTDSEDEPQGSDIAKASNDLDKELTGRDAIVQKFNQASEIIKKHKARVKSGEKSKEDLKATFQSYLLNQLKFPTSSQVYKDLMSIWTTEVK